MGQVLARPPRPLEVIAQIALALAKAAGWGLPRWVASLDVHGAFDSISTAVPADALWERGGDVAALVANCMRVSVRPRVGPVEDDDVQLERRVRQGGHCTLTLWNRLVAPAVEELLHTWRAADDVVVSSMEATVDGGVLL